MIEARGPDAADFLQNQLTQDLSRLTDSRSLFSAWCNPRGRVIATMRLATIDGGIAMVVASDIADKLIEMLLMYRFRAKVELSGTDTDPAVYVDSALLDPAELIRSGVPTVGAANTGMFTPHMLNLDKLDAISFSKGCYTGQEIVARTEHRGRSKRRMMIYAAGAENISVGEQIDDGGRAVGDVVNVAGRFLLAVTPVDRHAATLTVSGIEIAPQGLPYAI